MLVVVRMHGSRSILRLDSKFSTVKLELRTEASQD